MGSLEGYSEPASKAKIQWLDIGMFVIIAGCMLWGIGSYGLYEPHEAQYAGGANEMVFRGDWVTPYLNGAPELNKPPLFYWLIAISFQLLAHTGLKAEFVARLPLALISFSGVLLAWHWARELWGARAGRYAALMLLVASGWYIFSHQLLTDELLSVLILTSIYLLWKVTCFRESWWRWALFYGVAGVAVLAKGLPGLLFPMLILACFVLARRDWGLIRQSRPVLGFLIVSCIVGPWAYLFESHNPGALRYIIVNEHFKRAFDTRIPHDYGVVQVGVIQFLLITSVWCAPWIFLLPQIASFSFNRSRVNSREIEPHASRDAILLLAIAALLPVAFFVLIPSRLVYYGVPAIPPFTILCAGLWSTSKDWSERDRQLATGVAAVVGVCLMGATFFLPVWLADVPDLASTPVLLKDIPIVAFLMGSGFFLCGLLLFRRKERLAFAAIVMLVGSAEVFNVSGFAAFDSIFSSKRLVETLASAVGDDCVWIAEGSSEVGASSGPAFYLRQVSFIKASNVLIMSDDTRRPPPRYPGPPPKYLIDRKQLDEIWTSGRPVLYVTDFQRADWTKDKPFLPSQDCRYVPLPVGGHRHVYVNTSAWNRLAAAGVVSHGADSVSSTIPR